MKYTRVRDRQSMMKRRKNTSCLVFCQAVVQTVDNLLGPEALVSWADMSSIDQSRSASLLLDAVGKGAFLLANNLYEGRFSDRAPNIGMRSFSSTHSLYLQKKLSVQVFLCLPVSPQIWKCMC